MEEMVSLVLRKFCGGFGIPDGDATDSGAGWAEEFDELYRGPIEASLREMAYGSAAAGMTRSVSAHSRPPARQKPHPGLVPPRANGKQQTPDPVREEASARHDSAAAGTRGIVGESPPVMMRMPERLVSRKASKKQSSHGQAEAARPPSAPKPKQARKWEHSKDTDLETLDLAGIGSAAPAVSEETSTMDIQHAQLSQALEQEQSSDDEDAAAPATGFLGSLAARLSAQIVGKSALSKEDIAPALGDIRSRMTERNVAQDVAVRIVESVEKSLVGTRLAAATRISTVVRRAFKESLQVRRDYAA